MAAKKSESTAESTASSNGTSDRTPVATPMEPPKMVGRGKTPIHTPEVLKGIAEGAAQGWTSNGLTYKTKHGAQGACQGVKEALVAAKYAEATSDLTARVWESEPGVHVFAIAAKAAVR